MPTVFCMMAYLAQHKLLSLLYSENIDAARHSNEATNINA